MIATWSWPVDAEALVALQERLGAEATAQRLTYPWWPPASELLAGACFIASPTGTSGPGSAGDPAWVAAVTWRAGSGAVEQVVRTATVPAPYASGLLALREGSALAAAVAALDRAPDILLVDATGADHPRRAGLAVHLGAVLGIATVGVTHRALVAHGDPPTELVRGATAPLLLDGEEVARWVCTRTRARARSPPMRDGAPTPRPPRRSCSPRPPGRDGHRFRSLWRGRRHAQRVRAPPP